MSHKGEDHRIARLTGHKPIGFYLDIGANDPLSSSSNTHGFYERGWRGIDIEPIPTLAEKLRLAHPENVIFQCAVGAEEGNTMLFLSDPGGEGATIIPAIISFHESRGMEWQDFITVPVRTIDSILAEAAISDPIDFISMDIEGAEEQALKGFDLARWKPEILCIESTVPCTEIPLWYSWEPQVLQSGYDFIEFDGINRFYKRKT